MRPLEGVTILDLGRVLAAPFGTMILAELGARVIKIEHPAGDEVRSYEPFCAEESAYYFTANRGKQSLTLDLKNPRAQQVVRDLARDADVLIENFTVGSTKRFNLDYEKIKVVNPGIVYVSVTGFGQTGPYAKRRGYDTIFQAMTGMMALTGEPDGDPCKAGLPIADISSGLWAALGILSGLLNRRNTGEGVYIDLSMSDAQVSQLTIAAARVFANGEVPVRMGTQHPGRVPSAAYKCQDGWVQITCTDAHWPPLCKVLDIEHWSAELSLETNAARVQQREAVTQKLAAAITPWKRDQLVESLVKAGVPAGPVLAIDEVLEDEHFLQRGMIAHFNHPTVGRFPALSLPLKFNGESQPVGTPPLLGEHTDTVLKERLGLSAEAIEELRTQGAIG